MPTYEYANAAGERIEIMASMTKPPPERILVKPDGGWTPAGRKAQPERIYHRQYTAGVGVIVPNLAITASAGRLPVSRSAPRLKGGQRRRVGDHIIREHPNGIITNDKGQPIVDSNKAAHNVAGRTGMVID